MTTGNSPFLILRNRGSQATICLLMLMFANGFCFSQDDRPKIVFFGGSGLTNNSDSTRGSIHFGLEYEQLKPVRFGHYSPGMLLEGGYAFPTRCFDDGFGLFSMNYAGAYILGKPDDYLLFYTTGYSRLFGQGNAINYGAGYEHVLSKDRSIRLEMRDYYTFTGQRGHNLALRVAYMIHIED
jgi:hypothetical protein